MTVEQHEKSLSSGSNLEHWHQCDWWLAVARWSGVYKTSQVVILGPGSGCLPSGLLNHLLDCRKIFGSRTPVEVDEKSSG